MSSIPRLAAKAIEARERQFPLFLLSTVLPLIALPFATVESNTVARFGLPLAVDLLSLQSLRAMPPWQGHVGGIAINRIYQGLGVVGAINIWIPFLLGYQPPAPLRVLFVLIRAIFFVMTAVRIIKVLANSKRVNSRILSLGAAGYIHLGLTAGQLATLMQLIDNDSFRLGDMSGREELVSRLSYFAFVTIGTLGYGDVVPASPIGESFVVLLSITSTLYVSLLIGLLLSCYISCRTKESVLDAERVTQP